MRPRLRRCCCPCLIGSRSHIDAKLNFSERMFQMVARARGLPIPVPKSVRGMLLDDINRRHAGPPRGRSRVPPACPCRRRSVRVRCMLLDRKYIPHPGTPITADTIFKGFVGTSSHNRQTCRCLVLPVLRFTPISGSIELNGPEYRLRSGVIESLPRSARKSKLFFD